MANHDASRAIGELRKWANELLEEEYGFFYRITKSLVKSHDRTILYLNTVVFDRLPGVLRTYDPYKKDAAPLLNYCATSIKWYIYKELRKEDLYRSVFVQWDSETPEVADFEEDLSFDDDILTFLEEQLPRSEWYILKARYIDERTVASISSELRISSATVYKKLRSAFKRSSKLLISFYGADHFEEYMDDQ